uniref:Putative von Willebrand domain containing protein n=1 Tax=viral metagenome TaxID=1070528 RepID=A0A6H1Z6W2_9ZZZZ
MLDNIEPPPGFVLDAPESNLPPFDIALSPDEDPTEMAKQIVVGGLPERQSPILPIESELPVGFKLDSIEQPEGRGVLGDYAHTARAISETVIGLGQGMAGFLGGAATGLIELTQSPDLTNITDKDIKRAKAAAEKAAERLNLLEPQTEEAKQALAWVSEKLEPVFKTFRQMGEGPGKVLQSPALEYIGGVLAEVIGPAKLHTAIKDIKLAREFGKEIKKPRIEPEVKAAEVAPPEGFVVDKPVIESKPVDIVTERPVVESLPEAKVETAPKEIVEPGAILEPMPGLSKKLETGEGTSIKNAVTLAERESRGLSEVEVETRRSNTVAFDEGKRLIESGEIDPRILAQELVDKPRAITPEETAILTIDRQRIKTDHKAAMDAVEKAKGDTIAEAEARVKLADIEEIYDLNDTAARRVGYESGASLQARKMMIDEDYSLSAMLQKQRVDSGKPVPPEMRTKLEGFSKQIEELNAKVKLQDDIISQQAAVKATQKLRFDVAKEQRQTKRIYAKEELSSEFSGLVKELNSILGGQLNVGVDPAAVLVLGKMAKNRVQSGIITVEGIVDSIYVEVQKMGVDLSKRDIRDAFSGYGITSQMSKEALAVQLRELKRQARLMSALEDAKAAQVPLKSGLQRDQPSAMVRALDKQVKQAMKESGVDNTKEIALKSFKTRTANRIKELEAKLESGDFTTAPKKKTTLDAEAMNLQFQRDKVIKKYHEAVYMDQVKNRTLPQKIVAGVAEAMNLSRAIKTSFDLSASLRQGGLLHFGDPRLIVNSTKGMLEALKSEKGQYAVEKAIQERPNYPLYKEGKLFLSEHGVKLSEMEENYMSRHADKIPGVGASQRAYIATLNVLRADKFDQLVANLSRTEKPTPVELKAIGTFVNEFTGRGSVKGSENALVGMNTIFFAPRYVLSRFQVLAGHPMWGGTARTRVLFAKEYAKTLTGIGVVLGMGLAAGGTIETDPRSSDVGKIRFGKTRIDPFAGLSQTTAFVGKESLGASKSPQGKINPLRENYVYGVHNPKISYGGDNSASVIGRFLRSKLSPVVGTVVTQLAGEDVVGNKVTAKDIPEQLLAPISFNDIYATMKFQGVPAGTALGILSLWGMGIQSYDTKKKGAW